MMITLPKPVGDSSKIRGELPTAVRDSFFGKQFYYRIILETQIVRQKTLLSKAEHGIPDFLSFMPALRARNPVF
jgi:hypothetical protein